MSIKATEQKKLNKNITIQERYNGYSRTILIQQHYAAIASRDHVDQYCQMATDKGTVVIIKHDKTRWPFSYCLVIYIVFIFYKR